MHRPTLLTQTAYGDYLRHGLITPGAPTALNLKQARTSTHYIWRTRRDGRVRSSHAENDGKIFAWDNPPPTGHPGDAPRCRCTAEPHHPQVNEHLELNMFGVADASVRWTNQDFLNHYRQGRGVGIRLRDTGHLQSVVDEFQRQAGGRLLGQIADEAREKAGTSFLHAFEQVYYMTHMVFSFGRTTIEGDIVGTSRFDNAGALNISGSSTFKLKDIFEDPIGPIDYDFPRHTPYEISDNWQGSLNGVVNINPDQSGYRVHPTTSPSRGDRYWRRDG